MSGNDTEADLLSKLPQFVHIGPRLTSSKRIALSEPGTEYEVGCVKHMYASHVLLQFSLANTLEDQLLEEVTVSVDLSTVHGLRFDSELKCVKLRFGSPANAFVCLRRLTGVPIGSIPCVLKFLVKDIDPSWKKQIYKIIARLDDYVPEYFKSQAFLEQLE